MTDEEIYKKSVELAKEQGKCSVCAIQRMFGVGYETGCKIRSRMVQSGIVTSYYPHKVIIKE